ncbi:hypothetical protein PFICI_09763 [Pestalotiopsis fici W106-1]|uniref:Uncharacterized protein n=1 Tax=Pestalotiopsis fici (strain W106-1 / CGMCC3.15140) TaxID=1229662 RepID=W3WXU0_PESFW|nr:uncharacterized protein PFICI_09763 [Pestalotiopsis fici W106-1]ETS77701.1 hypothetical protein PFICI_09763 [Pestalotiopsis fici W106-1]
MASSYPPPIVYQLPKSPSKLSTKVQSLFTGTKLRSNDSAPQTHGSFAHFKNVSESTIDSNLTVRDTGTMSNDARAAASGGNESNGT